MKHAELICYCRQADYAVDDDQTKQLTLLRNKP